MVTSNELGRRIRQAREEAGISQRELGKLLEPPRSHAAVSDMERGVTRVGATDVAQIARIFGRPTAFFYGEDAASSSAPSAVYGRGDLTEESVRNFKLKVDRELDRLRKDKRA